MFCSNLSYHVLPLSCFWVQFRVFRFSVPLFYTPHKHKYPKDYLLLICSVGWSKEISCGLLLTTLSAYYVDCTKVQLLRGLIFKSSYSLKEQRKETHCRVLWGFNSVFFFFKARNKRLNSKDLFKY